jgi:uncharacterized membrane protein
MFKAINTFKLKEPQKWNWITAGAILLLALLIRLIGLGAESAWIDEAYSIVLAKHSILDILRGTAADQHPPLYYLLLHVWLWFGSGVVFTRLLCVVIGVIHIGQVLVLGRKIGGEWLGLGAGLLLTLNPMHVWYSQEARQYILLAVLTTAATAELWDCLHGHRRWGFYALFTILALYTQYFAVFIILAHAVWIAGWAWWKRDYRLIIPWVVSMLVTGIAFSPWLPVAINQFRFHTMSWVGEPLVGDVRDVFMRLLLGSGILAFPDLLRWIGLILLLAFFIWAILRLRSSGTLTPGAYNFLANWALIPFSFISLIAFVYPIFQFKQYLILLAPFLLFAVITAELLPDFWKHAFFLALLLSATTTLVYQQVTLSKDDWRGAGVYLEQHAVAGDVIYSNPAASSLALSLYMDSPLRLDGYPPDYDIVRGGWEGDQITPEIAARELTGAFQLSCRLWLVEFSPEFWDPGQYLPGWLQENGKMLDEQWFGNIHIRLFELISSGCQTPAAGKSHQLVFGW